MINTVTIVEEFTSDRHFVIVKTDLDMTINDKNYIKFNFMDYYIRCYTLW
jgi:hypothetical protein